MELATNKHKTEGTMKQKLYELERKFKDTSRLKMTIEQDCRNLTNQLGSEMKENYASTMTLDKNEKFGAL